MSTQTIHLRTVFRALAVLAAAVMMLTVSLAENASAHGSAINPASRNYGCWKRWGSNFQSPDMATQDPMCWQAWRADPNAMWNWNGLYREGVAGRHEQVIPNGQLCSAGRTQGGRYAAMDAVGNWTAQRIGTNFTVQVHDAARHGADYYKVYVTKQGFNPATQPLTWSNLELVRTTGPYAPGAGTPSSEPQLGGVTVSINASAPGRTGRHIVYTIWQAAHLDQSYYLCSDVIFG